MRAHLAFDYKGNNHKYHKELWHKGVKNLGWEISPTVVDSDFVVMWGPNPPFPHARELGKPVLMVDFPYWNRGGKDKTGREYYKVSVNGQHPTPYIMQENHSSDRFIKTRGPAILPWREKGEYILFAGMGRKAANQNGYRQGEWEAITVKRLRKETDMRIVYRPKPSKFRVPAIETTEFDDGSSPIEEMVRNAHAVVCHHGNPTVVALAHGVPIFMNGPIGAASHLALFEFDKIKSPIFPDNREKFFNNLAHWQWSVDEIKSGDVLLSYKARGFIG